MPEALIHYVIGDATRPRGGGNKIIVHCCNNKGLWGAGFVVALSKRWARPEHEYRAWSRCPRTLCFQLYGERFELGAVQFVPVEYDITVANLVGQHDVGPDRDGTPPVRYQFIEIGLQKTAAKARTLKATIHMPRMGCGLAGGRWERIEEIIKKTCAGLEVYVYDLPKE